MTQREDDLDSLATAAGPWLEREDPELEAFDLCAPGTGWHRPWGSVSLNNQGTLGVTLVGITTTQATAILLALRCGVDGVEALEKLAKEIGV